MPSAVLCSKFVTSVIVEPSEDMVNVLMKPSPSESVYASTYLFEPMWMRELYVASEVPCSNSRTSEIDEPSVANAVLLIGL